MILYAHGALINQSIKFALVGVVYEVCNYAFANMFVVSTRIVLCHLQPYIVTFMETVILYTNCVLIN